MEQSEHLESPEPPARSLAEQVAEDMREDRLELPGFPEAVFRIQRTLQSPEWTVEEVVRILSAEPALAARALQIANSVAFRRREGEVTDLRAAVNLMGANLMRSVAIAFAISQLRLREIYSAGAREEIELIWRDSLNVAAACYVVAKYCTSVNTDQAMLSGLLHVLGRLYVVMRAEGIGGEILPEALEQVKASQAAIGKAILEAWGLPEALQHAVEHQDDLDYEGDGVSLTDVLIAAKALAANEPVAGADGPVIERLAALRNKHPRAVLQARAEEVRELRSCFGG